MIPKPKNMANSQKYPRRSSRKSEKYYRQIESDRLGWRNEQTQACMWCGGSGGFLGLQIHEINRRSHSPNSWWDRSQAILLCGPCHNSVFATLDMTTQLALKMLRDNKHYSLERWLDMTGRQEITQEAVTMVMMELKKTLPDLKPKDFPAF